MSRESDGERNESELPHVTTSNSDADGAEPTSQQQQAHHPPPTYHNERVRWSLTLLSGSRDKSVVKSLDMDASEVKGGNGDEEEEDAEPSKVEQSAHAQGFKDDLLFRALGDCSVGGVGI